MTPKQSGIDRRTFARLLAFGAPAAAWTAPLAAATGGGQTGPAVKALPPTPAREICRLARERGALTLVDGAQSFGVLDIDVSDMQPDFLTGSARKWPCGPRDEGVMAGLAEALRFEAGIGGAVVEARSRALAQRLRAQLVDVPGVTMWTSRDPSRSAAIVTFKPGSAEPAALAATLYQKERIACTGRGGGREIPMKSPSSC